MQRIAHAFNIDVEKIRYSSTHKRHVAVTLPIELTPEEEQVLQAILSDTNAENPPDNGKNTVFTIHDLWEEKSSFQKTIGDDKQYRLYYSESVVGSGNYDRIVLQFDEELTEEMKERVKSAYASLITVTNG